MKKKYIYTIEKVLVTGSASHSLDPPSSPGTPLPTTETPTTASPCPTCSLDFDLVFGGVQTEDKQDFWWTDWEEVQRSRRGALNFGCRNVRNSKPKSLQKLLSVRKYLYNLLVDDKHKAIYCYVPK
ncbi:hypothetical protein SK128_019501, partial [Halocaridina rubra]